MNENQSGKKSLLIILGLLVLIAAMALGVNLIFMELEKAIPRQPVQSAQSVEAGPTASSAEGEAPAPSFCPHCGEGMPGSFQWGQFCPYCGEKVEQ